MPPTCRFSSFFDAHYRWLHHYLRRTLRNPDDADDIASETFYRVSAARIELATIDQPRGYLATVARRLIHHRSRRLRREEDYLAYLAQLPEPLMPSPEQHTLLTEALLAIEQALAALPAAVKQAFLFSQVDRLGYAEIARRLNVSERTVGRYTTQALRQCSLSQPAR